MIGVGSGRPCNLAAEAEGKPSLRRSKDLNYWAEIHEAERSIAIEPGPSGP